jgi:hypothetical protein
MHLPWRTGDADSRDQLPRRFLDNWESYAVEAEISKRQVT